MDSAVVVMAVFFIRYNPVGKPRNAESATPMPHSHAGEGANARMGPIAMRSSQVGPGYGPDWMPRIRNQTLIVKLDLCRIGNSIR